MIRRFSHIGISVADLNRSIGFYTGLLDLELLAAPFPFSGPLFSQVMALEDAAGRIGVVRKGDLQLELFEFSNPAPATQAIDRPVNARGLTHFGIEVDDIDAAYDRLAGAGVRLHCPVTRFPGGVRATYARDPDGNVFELLEMPASRRASP